MSSSKQQAKGDFQNGSDPSPSIVPSPGPPRMRICKATSKPFPLTDLNPLKRQLEAMGRRLYTRELVEEAAAQLAKAKPAIIGPQNEGDPASAEESEAAKVEDIPAPGLNGVLYKVWPSSQGYTRKWRENGKWHYAKPRGPWYPRLVWQTWYDQAKKEGPLFWFEPVPDPKAGVLSPGMMEEGRILARELEEKWQHPSNRAWTAVQDVMRSQFDFQSQNRKAVRIDNIICFALGTLVDQEKDKNTILVKRLDQHVFVCCVARWLQSEYSKHGLNGTASPIPIYVFDPDYSEFDRALLAELNPPITVVPDPHCFLQATANSFIVSVFCPLRAPNLGIIADLLWQSGGPAAILRNTIRELEENRDGFVDLYDECIPPVLDMLKGFEESKLQQWKELGTQGDHNPWWRVDFSLYTRKPNN
ncbi:hypothetical protein K491DRAFT_714860 [Lophiostoma macrostomum CBS 122681]|uniref:SRR1-like domain-containing protein n=1 Tax=Lophiostoma macrostomum CBS 122681 TaxID=1314788 RepID=A0A6A6TBF2_9PLEO|nr:hypothetical protein K491DRAFT_714860 [Lophiostoma macrostomum CBS 122681]